ncbi:uncharacterized protein LOC116432791 [Nomia melanderi]|uniref:uncharacterized protein LOC116432791 n=1 Tax=Nomia melanderi TaxID=2448451 RepID=UPI003FCD740F
MIDNNEIRRPTSRAIHECVKCGACFCHTRKLVEHLKNLHGIDKAFSCDECGKTFRSPMNIARHKLIHTGSKRFACDLCDYRSNQKSNLESHRKRHTKEYAFECEECQKGFFVKTEYLEHMNVHTRKQLYPCEHCGKSYPYKKNLLAHVRSHHTNVSTGESANNANWRHICKVCLEGFAQKLLLVRHLKIQHGLCERRNFLCDLCGTVLSSNRRLMTHRRSHANEKVAMCNLCGKEFASKENLSIHQRIHTGVKPYVCTQCGRGFTQRTSLMLHLSHWITDHDELADCDEFRIKSVDVLLDPEQKRSAKVHDYSKLSRFEGNEKVCDLCQEKFHFVTRLVAHLRIVHGIHRPFKCITCGKTYPQQFMLNAHVKKSHTPKTTPCGQCSFMGVNATDVDRHAKRHHREVKFTCEICSENFIDKDSLMTHTAMHNFMQYQQCNACGSTFNDVYSLKEHNRLYHYDPAAMIQEKLDEGGQQSSMHKCDVCGKVYKYKSVLKQHKVKAHGDTPNYERRRYLCALCGKELKTAKGLEIHNRSHTGEKPYTCEVCGKCFACETLLRTHNVTHTGERKYSCDQCGKAFTQRSTLVVHKRYHTGERPYVCPRCGKGFVTRTVLNTHMKSCR